jgi:hypothetical protein
MFLHKILHIFEFWPKALVGRWRDFSHSAKRIAKWVGLLWERPIVVMKREWDPEWRLGVIFSALILTHVIKVDGSWLAKVVLYDTLCILTFHDNVPCCSRRFG